MTEQQLRDACRQFSKIEDLSRILGKVKKGMDVVIYAERVSGDLKTLLDEDFDDDTKMAIAFTKIASRT